MNLHIIKKGTARNRAITPFFFAEEPVDPRPMPYIAPESVPPEELAAAEEYDEQPIEAIEEEPAPPPIDIEQLEKDAFERGFAEGRDEGLEEGLKTGEENAAARIEEMAGHYTDALAEVAALKDTLRAQVEEEVVRLALAVAKKIVHREIHVDPTIIHALVRVALERVSGKSAVVVRLSPTDYKYLTDKHKDMSQTEGREIRFESDNSLMQGDCMIQTEAGDIDARLEEEFNEVESSFFEG